MKSFAVGNEKLYHPQILMSSFKLETGTVTNICSIFFRTWLAENQNLTFCSVFSSKILH